MKLKKFLSAVLAVIGVCTAAAAVTLTFKALDSNPVLLTPPIAARSRAVFMMNSICDGDYDEASQMLLGTPDLGVDREASDDVGVLIWDAFSDSLSYELDGACYATDDGLAQNVVLTCLDINSVTARLRERSQTLLEQRVEEAVDTSEIYDENYDYREDFVMGVLYEAAQQALEEDAQQTTVELTLNLSYQNGEWWVVPDSELLDAISGGILY